MPNIFPDGSECSSRFFAYRVVRRPFQRLRVVSVCLGESITSQADKDACDINSIIKRFKRTGELPAGRQNLQYADVVDLQSADAADLIVRSRDLLADVDSKMAAKADAEAAAAKEVADRDAAELAAFRAASAKAQEEPPVK